MKAEPNVHCTKSTNAKGEAGKGREGNEGLGGGAKERERGKENFKRGAGGN